MIRCALAFFVALALPASAGTLVDIRLSIGTISLELYDADKPITVANFLNYISSGRYNDSFAHRLDPGFVLQGGGFFVNSSNMVDHVTTDPAIPNEYSAGTIYSNTYGTIAMARVGKVVDSATSQWFINLGNNSGLDAVDGGFTVFGHVISGFDVLTRLNTTFDDADLTVDGVFDATASLKDSTFNELPLYSNSLTRGNILFTEVAVVPEPGSLALALLGTGLISLHLRRRQSFPCPSSNITIR